MDSSVASLKRTLFSFQQSLSLQIEKSPDLARPPENVSGPTDDNENHIENGFIPDEPSPQYSYLPSPPLRVSNFPSRKFSASETLEKRAFSVPAIRLRTTDLNRLFHSCNDDYRRIPVIGTDLPPESTPNNQLSQSHLDELFARTRHSSESFDDDSATPDPLMGIALGPHQPPVPTEPVSARGRIEHSLFPNPLTEFMENRMILFRPTSSQNNVESLLNNTHPYQAQPDLKAAVEARRSWSSWLSPRTSISGAGTASGINSQFIIPNRSGHTLSGIPGSTPTDHQSSGSFLPRIYSLEPPVLNMEYTPRAAPLADMCKDSPLTGGGCSWCIF